MTEHAPAHGEDHRSMATHQFGERRFIAIGRESVEQLPIGAAAGCAVENAPSVADGRMKGSRGHCRVDSGRSRRTARSCHSIINETPAACSTAEIFANSAATMLSWPRLTTTDLPMHDDLNQLGQPIGFPV